jgi:hypothetical protein
MTIARQRLGKKYHRNHALIYRVPSVAGYRTNKNAAITICDKTKRCFPCGPSRDFLLGNCVVTHFYNHKWAVFSVLGSPCSDFIMATVSRSRQLSAGDSHGELVVQEALRGVTIKFANSPQYSSRWSSEQKPQYGLRTSAYQRFTAVLLLLLLLLLLICGSLLLSGVYYYLSVFWCAVARIRALSVREFLASKEITVLEHPPYSPHLAPVTFFSSRM